jgi:serine/threonine protein kinase
MLCYQLYSLHSGLKSKTATAYAHRDLKPDNITWDPTHGLNLVDFGFSREKPLSKNREKMGSALYMALYTRFARDEITNAQHDFLALRRTLYVPDTFVYQNTRRKLFHQTFPNWEMVLSKSMVDAAHLRPYVDTGCRLDEIDDKAEVDFGPLELAAILVVAKVKRFNHYYHQITQDPELASAIVLLYLNLQENDALLKEKIFRLLIGLSSPSFNEDKSTLSLLFFANIIENYNDALLNQDLLDALSNASDHKQQLALGILFKLGLTHPSDFLKLSQTRKLVEAVIFLAKVGAHNAIKNLFESSKHFRCFEALRDADLHSKMADLECRCPISLDYLEKSNDPALSKAIILLVDNNYQSSQIFSSLVQQKNRSFFHKAEHCALKAVYFLHKFHSLRLYLNILQRHKLSLLNRLEAFTESSYFKGFPKRHFDVCLTLVFTNDSFMALVERCGFYDIRLHMVLTLILLGFDNQETLANLASCDDYLMKYYPLFDNGAYKNEIILNVFRDPHYDKAYNLCKKNYISTKDTALILGNKKHLSALLALDESDVSYLQIFDLIKADAHSTTSQLFINRQRSLPRRLPPTPPESSVAIPEALSQLTL